MARTLRKSSSSNPYVRFWELEGSRKGDIYKVSMRADGAFACSCPAWKFHKAPKIDCKHINFIRKTEWQIKGENAKVKITPITDQPTREEVQSRTFIQQYGSPQVRRFKFDEEDE